MFQLMHSLPYKLELFLHVKQIIVDGNGYISICFSHTQIQYLFTSCMPCTLKNSKKNPNASVSMHCFVLLQSLRTIAMNHYEWQNNKTIYWRKRKPFIYRNNRVSVHQRQVQLSGGHSFAYWKGTKGVMKY